MLNDDYTPMDFVVYLLKIFFHKNHTEASKIMLKVHNKGACLCGIYSFDSRDDVYMNKFNCCHDCYIKWVEFREKRWLSGWRPNEGE